MSQEPGVLTYSSTTADGHFNIGDYIQSVAAQTFVGQDARYIGRENLNEYTGVRLKAILNGWYMHHPDNWPPSNKIEPLLVSMHINPSASGRMLCDDGMAYLKKFEPIGCRDRNTERILKQNGIDAYFSGCLTLTLGRRFVSTPEHGRACFVDPYFDRKSLRRISTLMRYIADFVTNIRNFGCVRKIATKMTARKTGNSFKHALTSLLVANQFYLVYSQKFSDSVLCEAEYVSHMCDASEYHSEDRRFELARELLERYAGCEFVVTSRIHAALPCLGMGVPVIFVTNDYFESASNRNSQGRFSGLLEFLNVLEYTDKKLVGCQGFEVKEPMSFGSKIVNKTAHVPFAKKLESQCDAFVGDNAGHVSE